MSCCKYRSFTKRLNKNIRNTFFLKLLKKTLNCYCKNICITVGYRIWILDCIFGYIGLIHQAWLHPLLSENNPPKYLMVTCLILWWKGMLSCVMYYRKCMIYLVHIVVVWTSWNNTVTHCIKFLFCLLYVSLVGKKWIFKV